MTATSERAGVPPALSLHKPGESAWGHHTHALDKVSVLIANYGRCIADSHELAAPRKSAESGQARTCAVLRPFRFTKPLSSICSGSIEGAWERAQ
jgi:hypothetical protein